MEKAKQSVPFSGLLVLRLMESVERAFEHAKKEHQRKEDKQDAAPRNGTLG